jgi:nucleotide-binding universal stress UspA family protein
LYNKILVPIDGSSHSYQALKEAVKIARLTGGSITLLNVQPITKNPFVNQADKEGPENFVLGGAKKAVEKEGLFADAVFLRGDIVEQIVRTAKDGNFDLIVIGARGLSTFEEVLLGSVSRGVVEKAPCPVIVTR